MLVQTHTHLEAKQIRVTEIEGLLEAIGKSYPEENATCIKLEKYFEIEYEKGKKNIEKKSRTLKKKKLLTKPLTKHVEEKGDEFSFIDESNIKDVTIEPFNSSIGEAHRKRLNV